MAIGVANYTGIANTSATSGSITIPATAAGNCLVVCWGLAAGSGTIEIATISATGATFVNPATTSSTNPPIQGQSGVNSIAQMSYALNIPSGITSVAWSITTAHASAISVYELSGVATASAVDASNVGTTGSTAGTAQSDPTLTPTVAGDIYIGTICAPSGTLAVNQAGSTPTSGWNGHTTLTPSSVVMNDGYQILAGTAAAALAWTLGTSNKAGLCAMLFKAAAGGGGGGSRPRGTLGSGQVPISVASTR